MSCDLLDKRFRGDLGKFSHAAGYNRSFGDGHASFFADPPEVSAVEKIIVAEGNGSGTADGRNHNNAKNDEAAYEYMKVDKR